MTTYTIRAEDFTELTTRWATHEEERPAIERALRHAGLIVDVLYLPLLKGYYLDITIPGNVNVAELEVE